MDVTQQHGIFFSGSIILGNYSTYKESLALPSDRGTGQLLPLKKEYLIESCTGYRQEGVNPSFFSL